MYLSTKAAPSHRVVEVEVEVVEVEVEVGPDITKWARAVVKPHMLKPSVLLLQ